MNDKELCSHVPEISSPVTFASGISYQNPASPLLQKDSELNRWSISDFSKWNIKGSTSSTHAQTFYVTCQDSTFILLQLVYSTMNSWSHSVQATLRVYPPAVTVSSSSSSISSTSGSEKKKGKTIGCAAGDFTISPDGYSVNSGCISIEMDADGSSYKLAFVDPDGGFSFDGILYVDTSIGAAQVGTGLIKFGEHKDDGSVSAKFIPKASCTGSYVIGSNRVEFKDARACAINAVSFIPQAVYQWNFLTLQTDTDSIMLYQCNLSKSIHCLAFLILNNKIESILINNKTTFHSTHTDSFSGYKIPSSITHLLTGTMLCSEKPVRIKIHLLLSRLLDKIDVLGELPYLVKIFIQTFVTAPFCYQWLEDCSVQVQVGEEQGDDYQVFNIAGTIFNETSFLNPKGGTHI